MPVEIIPANRAADHAERAEELRRDAADLQDRAADACIQAHELLDRIATLKARLDDFLKSKRRRQDKR